MLSIDTCALLVIDIQEKLTKVIYDREKLIDNNLKIIKGAKELGVPVLLTEQYPKGLGLTIPELAEEMEDIERLEKLTFSCCGENNFTEALEKSGRKQILVTGIETHVCVYQTVADLLEKGYEVHLVADCVSSREKANRNFAIRKMKTMGAQITTAEMCLFELMKTAKHPCFKAISNIVK